MSIVLTSDNGDARSWQSHTIDVQSNWYYVLSESCLRVLQLLAEEIEKQGSSIVDTSVNLESLAPCAVCLRPVRDELANGRGFAIVHGFPVEECSQQRLTAMYWALGHLIGKPQVQDIGGTLLFDVRDTGQDVSRGARFSVTNAESGFHTDCAFNPGIPEVVGLLCLQTARNGGRSQLVSAYAVHDRIANQFPDALKTLYEPFQFDRRGQHQADEPPTLPFPVFAGSNSYLCTRYMHYYIQVGQDRAGKPLDSDQIHALEVMEEVIHQDSMRIEFDLQPGQMLFTSNHCILHNRTAFIDHDEADRRRHYVRLWLNR